MEPIKLNDLRKLAIDKRTEIFFADPRTGRTCKVNAKGVVEVTTKFTEPIRFTIEEVLEAAQEFSLVEGRERKVLGREQMAEMLKGMRPSVAQAAREE